MTANTPLKLADHYHCWPQLQQQRQTWTQSSLLEQFQKDPQRANTLSLEAAGLYLDYSKNHLNKDTLDALVQLAAEAKLPEAIRELLSGAEVNNTEKRPALHSALRFQGQSANAQEQMVADTLDHMARFVDAIHSGSWTGFEGGPIVDVVNIGIGGSDLGPRMVVDALTPFQQHKVHAHFVANIDGAALHDILQHVDPASTLFIVASKSFSTLETIANARAARGWLLENGCPEAEIHKHFVAVSSRVDRAVDFGIAEANIFPMWDWVGGRYSLWSAIGLPIALSLGMDNFNALRAGAHAMDQHAASAPIEANMPALMALITLWYSHFWGAETQAVLPYSHHMHYFPEFLQQLDMESLGKTVCRNGQPLADTSGLVIWGAEGSNGQHSFHQLLHQGSHCVPVDFISTLTSRHNFPEQHRQLFACCISQSQALMQGKSLQQARDELLAQGVTEAEADRLAPHKVIPGNRPSNTLVIDRLTPQALGALIALYEHKVYCLSVLMRINAFDQWGVELGKELGTQIDEALLSGELNPNWDSSTQELLRRFRRES